jgi:hypothetical protein
MKRVKEIIKSREISIPYFGKTVRAFSDHGTSFSGRVVRMEDHGYLGFWCELHEVRNKIQHGRSVMPHQVEPTYTGFIDGFTLSAARKV